MPNNIRVLIYPRGPVKFLEQGYNLQSKDERKKEREENSSNKKFVAKTLYARGHQHHQQARYKHHKKVLDSEANTSLHFSNKNPIEIRHQSRIAIENKVAADTEKNQDQHRTANYYQVIIHEKSPLITLNW